MPGFFCGQCVPHALQRLIRAQAFRFVEQHDAVHPAPRRAAPA
jgi:hypothetical protein